MLASRWKNSGLLQAAVSGHLQLVINFAASAAMPIR
jgi:hypothetical protein